jgi:hypothetical protein
MDRSYLVQRLQKPYPNQKCIDNPFEFGGGLKHGGIGDEAYRALNRIFRFDYMGAAEFEFGAVPTALGQIFNYYSQGKAKVGMVKVHRFPVYYLCYEGMAQDVEKRIKEFATPEYTRFRKTKEPLYFDEALAARVPANIVPEKADKYKYYAEYIGWLDLDNHFIFFLEKESMDKFVELHDAMIKANDWSEINDGTNNKNM